MNAKILMDDLCITEKGLSRYDYHCLWAHHAIARDISCARRMAVSCPRACRSMQLSKNTLDPRTGPQFFITCSYDFFQYCVDTLHSDSVWNVRRPLWINDVTSSFDWKGRFPEFCRPILQQGCFPVDLSILMVGFFPNLLNSFKKVSKNRLCHIQSAVIRE